MTTKNNKKKNSKAKVVEKKAKTKVKVETAMSLSPTALRHKRVLKYITENNCSMKEALKALGYSKSSQNKPAQITGTKSWKQLLNQYLPEDKLLKIHEQQMNSWKLQSMLFSKQVADNDIFELMETVNCVVKKVVEIPTGKLVFYITPDNQSRNKALEMGLKLHKKLTDKVEIKDTTPFTQLTDAELAERIKKGKNFFMKK